MSFKLKHRKKKLHETRVTLDAKYNDKMQYFQNKSIETETKKEELLLIEDKLNTIYNKSNIELNETELQEKLNYIDRKKELEKEIKILSKNIETIDYLLNTGKILFNYYNENTKQCKKKKITKLESKPNKTVIDFFNPKMQKIEETTELKLENNIKEKEDKLSKAKLYENYLACTNDSDLILENLEDTNIELCIKCNIERTLYSSDGKMICSKCGDEIFILIDSDKPSYKEPAREISYFSYRRINHLNEWLAQFQAKESTDIPQDVYDQIILELKKERIENMEKLTPKKLRNILKKLNKNKYYEHVPHIINRLNGVQPPTISREIEEELRRMFKEIEETFVKFCPKNRKNFLSYSYVLHKFFQLLELDEFLPCFILLKSREKLHQQDLIWRKICNELRWEFIPSV